jgi:putative effector of murein hydrolase LrgA (UPF0299 family)
VRSFRTVLSLAMIVVGGYITVEMLHYPISASFTGIVLGIALIALGIVRLRAIYGTPRT